MASIAQSPISFSGALASDLLRSSSNGSVVGIPLKSLGRARFSPRNNRGFAVTAKPKKGKKRDYPWLDDADPDVKGRILTHLSHFKPSKERQKPVTLDFEHCL